MAKIADFMNGLPCPAAEPAKRRSFLWIGKRSQGEGDTLGELKPLSLIAIRPYRRL